MKVSETIKVVGRESTWYVVIGGMEVYGPVPAFDTAFFLCERIKQAVEKVEHVLIETANEM